MNIILFRVILVIFAVFHFTLQNCPQEVSNEGISVTWHQTSSAISIKSDPLCYLNDTLITRNCSNSTWIPALDEIGPCLKIVKYLDITSCPPGYYKISENNNDYCYQIGEPAAWDYPCFASGGASVITDFTSEEIEQLLHSLIATNITRYFWLPAERQKLFHPIVWYIPGPNWGQRVSSSSFLRLQASLTKNCLLLDVELGILITESCSKQYPSLCFYINDIHYPTKCPYGYHSFRFKLDNGTCFGIEKSDQEMSFNDFLLEKCKKPMITKDNDISTFIFKKISQLNNLPDNVKCWIKTPPYNETDNDTQYLFYNDSLEMSKFSSFEGVVDNLGALEYMNSTTLLPCMACEVEVISEQTEFMFEYNDVQNIIYLTVYYPSGLWKYNDDDKGIQCFSDAEGFVSVVDVNDIPLIETKYPQKDNLEFGQVEKIVYAIDLVTDSSAQYWCEGHTVSFSLITTDKIVANPKGNRVHVFSLVIKYFALPTDVENMTNNLTELLHNITSIYSPKRVLLMDIIDYSLDHLIIVLHLHITIEDIYEDEALNIQATFNTLKMKSELELPKYNYTFLNLSSSVYCLPSTSIDVITLDWEMTLIGHIAAPKQFCLQANGLPVKRHCRGSYMLGSFWGDVEGNCDNSYEPSETTTFLYNFVKRKIPDNYSTRFLTEGLNFVLGDTDIIIPADIYYISVSLQQILDQAQGNVSSIDTGDIENIAWIMDRMMILDYKYLYLAQTLNSTNVILDSVSDIIEIIAQKKINESTALRDVAYEIAVKPQFVVQITYPKYNNITGIAIVRHTASYDFTDMSIQPLYKNTTLEEVLSIKKLEIATWLPEEVLDTMQSNNNVLQENTTNKENFHIIITIFHNDAIFQELTTNKHQINSRIVGVSIPDYISNLEYPVPLVFKQMNHTINSFCGYWDFQPQQLNRIPGSWKKQGCYIVKIINDITVCECYHLTHFGQLLKIPDNNKNEEFIDRNHTIALNIITLIGSFLSLLGIVGIWITALVFSNWRKKAGTKVLLQLSTSIALPLVFILIFNLDSTMFKQVNGKYVIVEHMKTVCIVLGSLLHYSILASFMWMLITAILQFIRYVRVLGVRRPARFMFKFTLIGWGIPLLPVIITIALDAENYIPSSSTTKKICYPNGNYLIAGVLLPICIILFINITLFILVLHAISRGTDHKMKSTDMDLVSAQLRVSIFLFFLLGLTWIFGIFSFSNNLLWSYLFCLTSTLQGFVLFIYFVICDPKTRNLWITFMTPQFISTSSRNSISSITN